LEAETISPQITLSSEDSNNDGINEQLAVKISFSTNGAKIRKIIIAQQV
jgi:hypothetical protein